MSAPATINAIINKLNAQSGRISALQFGSTQAKRKLSQLKARVPQLYIPETSFVVLSTFLQNINLSIFTDQELQVLLGFDYSFIENKTATTLPVGFDLYNPGYDIQGRLINVSISERLSINNTFQQLLTMNSTLSVGFLINFITNQV